ncbi:hypothetical protein LTR70_010474 [Exophiala xenobiotica]|uniref:DUF6536 domain-containing protein n=1 Tax=Lithohypha guttulata TaxID=1690604 RepID=A0ABR0JTP1_9EURO|nr:hypothetical protein LTR24_010604 [Lithohypha guttulata]KAK5309230.1 hypothetical protein LTR70_010474 [Exophiala xenobiotica]
MSSDASNPIGTSALKLDSKDRYSRLCTGLTSSQSWKYARMRTWVSEPQTSSNPHRGWRKAVLAAALVTAIVLLINTILAIVAGTRSGAQDGVGTLFEGDCKVVEQWNTALHLVINVLGTCLLSASSFTMQCLSSPTRTETDRAHAKRQPLEIGVPSIKNLRHMHWRKGCLWWALCLSTLPLHLFWNSTILSTIGSMHFDYLVVDESFFSGAEYLVPNITNGFTPTNGDIADPAIYLQGHLDGNYTRLSPTECLDAYMTTFITSYRNLIAVTTPTKGMRMSPGRMFPTYYTNLTEYYGDAWLRSSLGHDWEDVGWPQPLWNGSSVLAYETSGSGGTGSSEWACLGWENGGADKYVSCRPDEARRQLQENGSWYLRPGEPSSLQYSATAAYLVDYCLAETRDVETCQLQYVLYILIVVIICNIIKLGSMGLAAYLLWDLREPILATVGDAVTSYIERPDSSTAGWCLMDYTDVTTSKKWKQNELKESPDNKVYCRQPTSRLYATNRSRWWTTMSLCFLYLIIGSALLGLATSVLSGVATSTNVWQDFSFGRVMQSNTLGLDSNGSSSQALLSSILMANSFQLVLSITYFLFNSLWTAQCAAKEWASFAQKCKALRVTWPRGKQRSTYYLSLPYYYGVPLTLCLGLLHFLISQSIFLARVQWYHADGTINADKYLSDAGFSPLGILVTVLVATVLLTITVIHSFARLSNRMPVHGNLSAVISAMCHCSTSRDSDEHGATMEHPAKSMAERDVMWGVTKPVQEALSFQNQIGEDDDIGHCAFTTEHVGPPVVGMRYQ